MQLLKQILICIWSIPHHQQNFATCEYGSF